MRTFLPPAAIARHSNTLLALVLIGSLLLKLHHLNHLALKGLDESFHAIVAASLLEHPLTPTLIDRPYLPYDYRDWQNNHVWLHKGIVPLWQIALSYLMFGLNTFALRLPSALLSTGAVLLTYLIGRELLDRGAAIVAATLQAFSPAILMLVHGYAFSDHIDISLLFWVEMGIWFAVRAMRTGSISDAALAGVAQGLAFLSKMYPALIVSVIAAAAWWLPLTRFGKSAESRFGSRHFAGLLLATLVTMAPWMLMCAIRFPDEFRYEHLHALQHLTRNVEDWAAPWDRLIFGYSLAAYFAFYPSVLVAQILLLVQAWREGSTRLWIVLIWSLAVLIPFTVAVSKTPSATLIGWPAVFLLFGEMISRALRGQVWMLGTWFSVTILAVLFRGGMNVEGMGGMSGHILRQNLWVLWHVLGALTAGAGLALVLSRVRSPGPARVVMLVTAISSFWLLGLWVAQAWKVSWKNTNAPAFVEIAGFVDSRLPADAVLLLEENEKLERNTLMWRSRRTTYPIDDSNWRDRAIDVVVRGGVPVIVSDRPWPLPVIYRSDRDGRSIYQLTPQDLGLAGP